MASVAAGVHYDSLYGGPPEDCGALGTYAALIIVLYFLSLVHSVAMLVASCQGGVMQPSTRAAVSALLHLGPLLAALELGCAVLGVVALARVVSDDSDGDSDVGRSDAAPACSAAAVDSFSGLNIAHWAYMCVGLCCAAVFYHGSRGGASPTICTDSIGRGVASCHRSVVGVTARETSEHAHLAKRLMSWRRCLCCNLCKDVDDSVFETVARELHQYFAGWDIVATDIIAGLILTAQLQKESHTSIHHIQGHTSRADAVELDVTNVFDKDGVAAQKSTLGDGQHAHVINAVLSPAVESDVAAIEDLHYYMPFALGVYGWLLHAFRHAHKGMVCAPCALCQLAPCVQSGCSCMCTERHPGIAGDNCCRCNQTGLTRTLAEFWPHGERPGIVFASWIDKVEVPAYSICVDRQKRSVVLAVRGTLSIQDCMTDCIAEEAALDTLGMPGQVAHEGMYRAACNIIGSLRNHNLLPLLLKDGHVPDSHSFRVADELQDCRGFDLVVCGHSLGAGAAALLTMLLRSEWPQVRCLAYSPPGGLLSADAAANTRDYITSVILGEDFIGRLSMRSMELLKDEMIECLAHTEANKCSIYRGAMLAACGMRPAADMVVAPDLEHVGTDKGLHVDKDQEEYLQSHRAGRSTRQCRLPTVMFPPGRVVFIRRLGSHGKYVLEPEWAANADFQRIAVSRHMLNDHLPNVVQDAIACIHSQFVDRP